MSTTFWVPGTREPPKFFCRICKAPFWEMPKYERHVTRCGNENEDELRANSPTAKLPFVFDPSLGDVEFRNYVRRTGNRH